MMAAALMGLVAIGCASPVPPSPTPVPSGFIDLPTLSGIAPAPSGLEFACAGVGFSDSVLRGSPVATDAVWLEPLEHPSTTLRVRWPAGFRARFSPELELLDSSGAIVAREADVLNAIGGSPGPDGRFNVWEFDGRSYPCY
jgi:hypothetical protein